MTIEIDATKPDSKIELNQSEIDLSNYNESEQISILLAIKIIKSLGLKSTNNRVFTTEGYKSLLGFGRTIQIHVKDSEQVIKNPLSYLENL